MDQQSTVEPSDDQSLGIDIDALTHMLSDARRTLRDGNPDEAVDICLKALASGGLELSMVSAIHGIVTEAGRDDLGNRIRDQLHVVLHGIARDRPDDPYWIAQSAKVLLDLGEADAALDRIAQARALAPGDFDHMMLHCMCMVHADRFDVDRLNPDAVFADVRSPAIALSAVATLLGNHDRAEAGVALLDRAIALCRTDADRLHVETLRAALSGEIDDSRQRDQAVEIFDSFAETYDQKLEQLGNNGPALIGRALEGLDLPKDGSLDVFDAGCGTGLCAPILRPYARHLHGVDLSIPMLVKCQAKGTFDLLTRTDLAARDTFPDARFDMAVSGDVLVYFGALDAVFSNLHDVLRPGGRVIFTVEEAVPPEPEQGFRPTPSGRKAHTEAYLRKMLAETGFPRIDLLMRGTLRHEFGRPIKGIVMAARRD